jgi:capsular polysaccharide export protein
MKKTILVHVDGPSRARFFSQLASNIPDTLGMDFLFVTESRAAEKILEREGKNAVRLTALRREPSDRVLQLYRGSLCGVLGSINLRVAAGYHFQIESIVAAKDPAAIWCWNGSKFVDRALRSTGITLIAFEVANIPGCFVVEKNGVNAESETYQRLVTEEMPVTPEGNFDFDGWKNGYVASKENQRAIPQAKVGGEEMRDKLHHLATIGRSTPRFVAFQVDRMIGYIFKPLIRRYLGRLANQRNAAARVVFFPQQVSSDTQLIFNSDYDNSAALLNLLSELEPDEMLVSNLHPAEHRLSQMLAFVRLCASDRRLRPVTGGAWVQLKTAQKVVTINSTVGLEAAILGRPCQFLGRSLFERLSRDQAALKWYLADHILPYAAALEAPVDDRLLLRILPDAAV